MLFQVLTLDDSFEREESVPVNSEFFCRTCCISLNNREDQINHYKSDSHRKKIKNRLRNRLSSSSESERPATEDEDEDTDTETEGDSGDSDSDWSEDEIITSANLDDSNDGSKGRARQEIQFYNKDSDRISFFRAMVASKSEYLGENEIYKRFLETRECFLQKGDKSGDRYDAVLLFAAGAFAGAIFINGEPIVHKVIKKYVIRAKQGKAQSTNDNMTKVSPVL